jgi:DNA-binding MarR family transcriptional regulator
MNNNNLPNSSELRVLESLRSFVVRSKDLPTSSLLALLTIALRPGLSINELAEALNMPQQSASRYASILLGRTEDQLTTLIKSPYISQSINDQDPRKRALNLTPAGIEYLRYIIGGDYSKQI